MFTRIIVPLDLEAAGSRPLWFVRRLATLASLPVELLTVSSPRIDERADHFELARWAGLLPPKLTSTTVLHSNDAAEAIVEHLAEHPDALVAMATNARGVLGEKMFGSVSEAVLADHVAPLLLFGPSCHSSTASSPPNLVVTIDQSEESDAVLDVAESWSDTFGGPTPALVGPGSSRARPT